MILVCVRGSHQPAYAGCKISSSNSYKRAAMSKLVHEPLDALRARTSQHEAR